MHMEKGDLKGRLKNWFEIQLQNILFSVVLVNVKTGFQKKKKERKKRKKRERLKDRKKGKP